MRIVKFLLPAFGVVSLLCGFSFAASTNRITGNIDPNAQVQLKGHVTPMARAKFDQGPVEPSRAMHVTMLLMPTAAQQRDLHKLIADQQNPSSPEFRKWLTPEQYGERFGLSHDDLGKITAWLRSAGFKVTHVARGRDFLSFEGEAGLVDGVFKTDTHYFNVNGKMHFANVKAPMIPAALSGIVGGFRGLHDFFPHPMYRKHPSYTVSGNEHFLAPGDLATIYDIKPLYQASPAIDGTGQKVVIAAQTDVYLADLNDFRSGFGLSSINGCTLSSGVITACSASNFQMVVSGTGSDPGVQDGDLGESDLDIEWLGSVARNAQIIFVTSSNGVDDSAAWAIDNTLAPVISYSYGLCEAFDTAPTIAATELVYQKASSEGIAFFAASGDNGAAECDGDNGSYPAILGPSVSYPASSPEVTAVGGTEFNEGSGSYWNATNGTDGGSATGYIPELAWNDTTLAGNFDATGGGASNCANGVTNNTVNVGGYEFQICDAPTAGGFPKPSWQVGITPRDSVRDVPDISFSASNANDAYIVCTAQLEVVQGSTSTASTCANGISAALTQFNPPSAFGGTSASTPVAAGMAVLLNQYLSTTVGPINNYVYTVIYQESPSVFHDILAGTSTTGTEDTSNNIEPCTAGDPTFEPAALQCPTTGTPQFGFTAGTGYDQVTGLGTIDINAFFLAWKASEVSFATTATALNPASISAGNAATSTIAITPQNTASQTATYTFSCSGLPAGATCGFSPTSVTGSAPTTLTITTLASMTPTTGTTVTVTATSGNVSESTTVNLVVTATTQKFTLSPQTGTYQVTAGQTVNASILLTAVNGFKDPVTYTCTNPPAPEAVCTGPNGPTTNTTVNFTITTTAPNTSQLRGPLHRGAGIFYAALLPGIFGIVFTLGSRKRSLRGMRLLGLIMVLGFSTLWLGSCGGNSGTTTTTNPGTPAGNYTVTINAQDGSSSIKAKTTFTLTVQ